MKKVSLVSFTILYSLFFIPSPALAVCPVCTVAVGAGLGLSRFLGIDDSISGVWIGGLILSSSLWLVNWLQKKKVTFPTAPFVATAIFYAITVLPLWFTGIIGHPYNKFWGIDKLILGIAFGSLFFLFGVWLDKKTRILKGQKLFQFQKIAFPTSGLAIISLVFYLLTK